LAFLTKVAVVVLKPFVLASQQAVVEVAVVVRLFKIIQLNHQKTYPYSFIVEVSLEVL
jgi:hypothetical protein